MMLDKKYDFTLTGGRSGHVIVHENEDVENISDESKKVSKSSVATSALQITFSDDEEISKAGSFTTRQ